MKNKTICPCDKNWESGQSRDKLSCKDLFYNLGVLNHNFKNTNEEVQKGLAEALDEARSHDFSKCMTKGLQRSPRTNFQFDYNRKIKASTECFDHDMKNESHEAFICRCFYKKSTGLCKREDCPIYNKVCDLMKTNFRVVAYQIPPLDGVGEQRVGAIDIVLQDVNSPCDIYFTEVKPETSPETLLRMVCEICTLSAPLINEKSKVRDFLTYKINGHFLHTTWDNFMKHRDKYEQNPNYSLHKAIAFFKGSSQEKEFENLGKNEKLRALFEKHNISVFQFTREGGINFKKTF